MSAGAVAPRIRVIGVGSPAADDRVGWLVVEALRSVESLPADVELLALDRPGADLVRHLHGVDTVILVDAALAGLEPGALLESEPCALTAASGLLSGHALGVADALALANALRAGPRRAHLLAVQAGNTGPLDGLHPAVRAAVPRVVARIRELLAGDP